MGRSCQQCGQEMSDLARFCSNCGAPLVDLSAEGEVQSTGNLDVPLSATGPLGAVGTGSVGSVAAGTAMLIVRRGPSEGTSFVLDSDLVTVGRSDDADVVLDDVTVSRRHAQFIRDAAGLAVPRRGQPERDLRQPGADRRDCALPAVTRSRSASTGSCSSWGVASREHGCSRPMAC